MTALAQEASPAVDNDPMQPVLDLDEALWQAWKAMELPEGFRAEIVEGFIEVSPTGRRRHGIVIHRLRRALDAYLNRSEYAPCQDLNVLHGRKVCIPDLFVGPVDPDEIPDEDGLGVDAAGVKLVAEVVFPGHDATQRDRVRKRRAYARAGIPAYVIIDDFAGDGTVTVLTAPDPAKAEYAAETHVPYGTEVAIPEGPAKGFVIGDEITRA